MSLIVTVYTSEGIIMASDSRTSFSRVQQVLGQQFRVPSGHYYDTVDKTFLAPNNCGISTCGDGSINNIPLSGIIKTFTRTQIIPTDTVLDTANKLLSYIKTLNQSTNIIFHVFGFDSDANGNKSMNGYRVHTNGIGNVLKVQTTYAGASWDGETAILSRILKKTYFFTGEQVVPANSQLTTPAAQSQGVSPQTINKESLLVEKSKVSINDEQNIPWGLMSIQDGIDFSEYAIKATIDTMKFAAINKSVGGPIDILVITPDNAEWVKKKKSY